MTISGKEYEIPKMNFSNVCRLEQWGIAMDNMAARPLSLMAGFVSLAIGGKTLPDGEAAIDAHLAAGGALDDIANALNDAINNSDFFKNQTGEKKPVKG